AAGVRGVGARDQGQRATVAVGVQGLQRLRRVRRPVAVAEVDRQVHVTGGELLLERRDQLAVLRVDGGAAAERTVVGGDVLEALVGYAATGGDVAQEGDHVLLALGAAEGGEQDRVVLGGGHLGVPPGTEGPGVWGGGSGEQGGDVRAVVQAAAGGEGQLVAHVQTGVGVAQVAHHVDRSCRSSASKESSHS